MLGFAVEIEGRSCTGCFGPCSSKSRLIRSTGRVALNGALRSVRTKSLPPTFR